MLRKYNLHFMHLLDHSSQGIEYLIEHNLLQRTPEDVARFLFQGEGLNKTAIGDYLGERYVSLCCVHVMSGHFPFTENSYTINTR